MKKTFTRILFFACVLFIYSCASAPEYRYGKDEIHLNIKSHPQLNLNRGTRHTLVLCVYQLKDPNAFNQLIEDNNGLSKLLGCTRFDPGVSSSKRFVIHPEQEVTKLLDRSEGAKYVGFVAGYFKLEKDHIVRLIEIPVGGFKKRAKKLTVNINLGPQEILEFRGE